MSEQLNADQQNTSFTHALMIELDYVAVSLRPVEFAAIKRGIEPKGIELTPIAFSRSPLSPDHRTAVTDILKAAGNKADAIEKAVGEVDKSVKQFIQQEAEPNAAINKLIEAAKKRGVAVFAYSALDRDDAEALMEKIGLNELGVSLLIPEEQRDRFPRADDWLKMLKQVEIDTKTVVAVVSSQLACKGALTAGAAVVSVPDEYTHYQDFSGSAFVLDALSDEKPDLLLDKTLRM
jgi:beta-phosphoglucomutase-like phosphatase (HAD superfamily)